MPLTDTTREEIARQIDPEIWVVHDDISARGDTAWFEQWKASSEHVGGRWWRSIQRATAIEPIINRLIAEAEDRGLERGAKVAEGLAQAGDAYERSCGGWDDPDCKFPRAWINPKGDGQRLAATAIRALKTKDNPHG